MEGQELVRALSSATSYNAAEREAATSYLQQCQPLPGFLTALIDIVAQKGTLPVEIRTQAVLFFKNSLERCWRKSGGPSGLDVSNKAIIRAKLLQLVDEPDRAIAKTLALCVGKIARWEFGIEWPDLFESLQATIMNACETLAASPGHAEARLVLHRCLLYYQQAVKRLSENRMLRGKEIIGRLAEQSTEALAHIYHLFFNSFTSTIQASNSLTSQADPHSESVLCILTFKILTRLSVYGWGGHVSTADGRTAFTATQTEFFTSSIDNLVTLSQLRKTVLSNLSTRDSFGEQGIENINKLVKNLSKFHRMLLLQNHHVFHELKQSQRLIELAWTFVEEASQDLARLVSADDPFALYPETFVVQQLLLVKSLFTQSPTAFHGFHNPVFAGQAAAVIITKLLPLRQNDLEKWSADPEEWWREEEDVKKWKFDLRPCAHAFLNELIAQYEVEVIPMLRQFLEQTKSEDTLEGVLQKEAVYTACGNAGTPLNKVMPFGEWLSSTLIPECQAASPLSRIIRHRIAWLVGQWIAEDSVPETQTKIYQLLAHLLGPDANSDLAVRLSAARSIGMLDSWQLDVNLFLPFLDPIMRNLSSLLEECELPETHRKIADILGEVIQTAGQNIAPHLSLFMEILPRLWTSAQDDDNFKMSIVVMLKKLVEALKSDSQVLHEPICQFIRISCDPASPTHGIMQDDGLDLWQSTLKWASAPSAELMSLSSLSVNLLGAGSDLLERSLRLVEGYALLDPSLFIPQHLTTIFSTLNTQLGSLSDKAAKPILYTMDLLVQASPVGLWVAALDQSHLFSSLVALMHNDVSSSIITRYLYSLARLAANSREGFNHLLSSAAAKTAIPEDQLLNTITNQWLNRYDNQTYSGQRKMLALGLTSLVKTTSATVLSRMDEIIGVWLSALSETREDERGESVEPSLQGPDVFSSSEVEAAPWSSSSSSAWRTSDGKDTQHYVEEQLWPEGAADAGYASSSQATISSRTNSIATTANSPIVSPVWSGTMELPEIPLPEGQYLSSAGQDMMMDQAAANPGAGGDEGLNTWPVADAIVSPSTTLTPTFTTAGIADHNAAWGYLPESPIKSTFASADSADGYYDNDEQIEAFELGWGEAEGDPGLKRLHGLIRSDPVHSTVLRSAIAQALEESRALNGNSFDQNWLASVDNGVMQEFMAYLSGAASGGD